MLKCLSREEKLGLDIPTYLAEIGIRAAMGAGMYAPKTNLNLLLTIALTYFPIPWKQMRRNLCWRCLHTCTPRYGFEFAHLQTRQAVSHFILNPGNMTRLNKMLFCKHTSTNLRKRPNNMASLVVCLLMTCTKLSLSVMKRTRLFRNS